MTDTSKICEQCGNVFTRPKEYSAAQWESRRYCSPPCSALGRRNGVEIVCAECGITFTARRDQTRVHCSAKCRRAAGDIDRRYVIDVATGCWNWTGAISNGYGKIREIGAHVAMYRRHVGDIPVGFELDHLCRNTRCVNPQHLEPVTHLENCLRAPRIVLARGAATCPAGHLWNDKTTYVDIQGVRQCRACAREKKATRHYAVDFRRRGSRSAAATVAPHAGFWLMRLVRHGPLVPARLRWLDHAPDDPPENKLDRGPRSTVPVVDIAGEIRAPEELFERMHHESTHWKYLTPIAEANYEFAFRHLRWAEKNAPEHPTLRPRRRVDPRQLPLPNFRRENQHVG